LRFAVYGDAAEVASYRRLAAAYMRSHPQATLRVEAVRDEETADRLLEQQFTTRTAPDVFLADSSRLRTLVGERHVDPVDRLLELRGITFGDRYERLGLEAFSASSALQCMPNDVSPLVVFYNRRLLIPSAVAEPGDDAPTAQTGWTWEQFATAARAMTQGSVRGVDLEPRLTVLRALLRSAGTDIVDDPQRPTTLTLSQPAAREVLQQVLRLARDRRVNLAAAQARVPDPVARFADGRLGMVIGTRALVPRLRHQPGLRFDVFPLPSFDRLTTVADVTGYCISRESRHVDAAADFIAFASGDRGARITAASGGVVPANLAVLQSRTFLQPGRFPRNAEVFSTVMSRADTMPDAPGWPDVVTLIEPLLERMFHQPRVRLDALLPRVDRLSTGLLAGPSPSPGAGG
jgi:multiple sugar transport system substrate-binding protein